MENEYALRLKDAATAERLRELADRGAAEREAERARADALLAEKNEAELEYEDQLRQAEQRHQARVWMLVAAVHATWTLDKPRSALPSSADFTPLVEMSCSKKVTTDSTRAQAAAAALEAQHQKALAAETERLEGVLRDKAELNARWDEQNRALVEGHERVVHEVTTEFEGKLAVHTLYSLPWQRTASCYVCTRGTTISQDTSWHWI